VPRTVIVASAFALALTACGPRFDQASLEATNGSLRPVRSSTPAATPQPGSSILEAPAGSTADAPPSELQATVTTTGSGAVGANPSGAVPAPAKASVKQSTSQGHDRAAAAAGAANTQRSPGAGAAGQPGGGPVPAVPAGGRSEVVLGSIGVEAGILGAVTGPAPPAIRAWASYVNSRGGLAGHRVRVIIADDGNDPARAQALVRQLVDKEGVIAFINEFTLNTLSAVMPYLESKQIPVIGSIGGDLIGGASPMMFNPLAGSYGVSHAWATLLTINAMTEKKKLGLVYCREVNGCTSYAQTIKKLMPYGGLDIVYEAQVSLAQPDYTAEMLEAQRAGAEVVFILVDSASIVRVAKSAHRQGYNPIFVAAFNASHDLVFTGGKEVEGLLVGGRYAPWDSSPLVQDYRDAMNAYQPSAPRGDLGGGVFIIGRLLETKIAPFLKEPPTSAQFLDGLYSLDKETLDGRLPGISFPRDSHEKVNLCTVPQRLVNGKFTTRDPAASFVCAPGWTPASRAEVAHA
jgi:branched-chain amino acid transport system substrate-binding protein